MRCLKWWQNHIWGQWEHESQRQVVTYSRPGGEPSIKAEVKIFKRKCKACNAEEFKNVVVTSLDYI